MKIEKKGNMISVFRKSGVAAHWVKTSDFESAWAQNELQVGFSVMARFAGNGPKQRPDMQAVFSNIKIEKL